MGSNMSASPAHSRASASSSTSPSTRKQCDFAKLMMEGYRVDLKNGSDTRDFYVKFHGPKDTPYEGYVYKVHVELPDNYPHASPSIGFTNKIFHPNIDERSGSVCLDVINQTWTPLYSLLNIFEVFLPQLLTYPNPTDPLNSEAASMLMRDKDKYNNKVRECCEAHAQKKFIYPDEEDGGEGGTVLQDGVVSELSGLESRQDDDLDDLDGFLSD